jgi:23S rRNA pseudouridine1911/1915/1917 synthase
MRSIKAEQNDAGLRADIFLARQYPAFSRSSLDGLFDKSLVRKAGKPVKASYKVRANDDFKVNDSLLFKKPADIELPVIYEDRDVVVINKPAGLLTHSKGALNLEPTVASFMAAKITDKVLTGSRAGIVHRLDRPTSGVIICARTHDALRWLQRQFADRKADKTYLAIVEGKLQPAEAIIDAPIGRNPQRPQAFKVIAGGKPAQTRYRLLDSYSKNRREYSLVELKPLTGRTHQIRVHLAYIGHPVAGDFAYGRTKDEPMLLHAYKLAVNLPAGSRRVFTAPIPKSFKDFAAP